MGALLLAYKLLVNDAAELTALMIGITLAVFGVLLHVSSTAINIGASIWVMGIQLLSIVNKHCETHG